MAGRTFRRLQPERNKKRWKRSGGGGGGGGKKQIDTALRIFYSVHHLFCFSIFLFSILFLQQDCPNGRLTPAKFVDMYKMFFPSGNAEEFCDHVFRTFDMDKNGYIDFKVSENEIAARSRMEKKNKQTHQHIRVVWNGCQLRWCFRLNWSDMKSA